MQLFIGFLILLGLALVYASVAFCETSKKKKKCCNKSTSSCGQLASSEDTIERYLKECREEDSVEVLIKGLIEQDEAKIAAEKAVADSLYISIEEAIETYNSQRIAERDFKVGDCFLESNGQTIVRMITELRPNGDWSYEYCPISDLEPYTIRTCHYGITKEDVADEIAEGTMIFCGTFDL